METYIITGASRGLGRALAEACMKMDARLILIARSFENQHQYNGPHQLITADLASSQEIERVIGELSGCFRDEGDVFLINNAGMANPIKKAGSLPFLETERAVHLNLLAPVMLTDFFIRHTEGRRGRRVIVNISTGAVKRLYEGWSIYSSTKAGLEVFTKTCAAEQMQNSHPAEIISFSPGVMDTQMQKGIRSSHPDDFRQAGRFMEYKEKGVLRSPSLIAHILLLLINGPLENGSLYEVNEMLKTAEWTDLLKDHMERD